MSCGDAYFSIDHCLLRCFFVQVIKGGTWEEVASALNFTGGVDDPFLLQEYYVEHLYDFEEMYFLGTRREPAAPVGMQK